MNRMGDVLEQVGWIAARNEMRDALAAQGLDLVGDWVQVLTEQAIAIADRGSLPFALVAEGFALAARRWWPEVAE
jgi:hypothetical protein